MPSKETETTNPENKRPYSYALDRAATGNDANNVSTEIQKGETFKTVN